MVSDPRTPSYTQRPYHPALAQAYPERQHPAPTSTLIANDDDDDTPIVIKSRPSSPWAATMSRMHSVLNGSDDISSPNSGPRAKRTSLSGPTRQILHENELTRNYGGLSRSVPKGEAFPAESVSYSPRNWTPRSTPSSQPDMYTRHRTQSFPNRPSLQPTRKPSGSRPPLSPSSPHNQNHKFVTTTTEHSSIYPGMNDPPIETAIAGQRRRANSASSRKEFVALATVFGVAELSEPKPLWERNGGEIPEILQGAIESPRGLESPRQGYTDIKEKDMARKSLQAHPPLPISQPQTSQPISIARKQQQERRPSTATSTSESSYVLPAIPNVSLFDEFDNQTSDFSLSLRGQSSVLSLAPSLQPVSNTLHPLDTYSIASTSSSDKQAVIPPSPSNLLRSVSPDLRRPTNETLDQRAMSMISHQEDIPPPLLFCDHPPTIFDYLKSDDDERIIIWGIDLNPLTASNNGPSSSLSTPQGASGGFNTTPPISPPNSLSRTSRWSSSFTDTLKRGGNFGHKSKESSDDSAYNPFRVGSRRQATPPLRRTRSGSSSGSSGKKRADRATPPPQELVTGNRVIMAATVEKLVEKLTSTLDYTFMTDFFLTYRTFISPVQLCKLLILRFRWALENDEEDRRVVRIRTFVTFRHWLLNYFVHDFIPSKALRFTLTSYLNSLPQHPLVRKSPRDQRIVKGLKRVVRRLKKVYYRKSSSNTHRVKVVRAPPPTPDHEKIEQMVRAKLSSHSLRKKTLAMGGNAAITDVNSTPVVVVGSLRKKNGPFGSIRGDSPNGRPASPARIHNDTVSAKTIHMQHLQKQEEIERRKQQEKRASVSSDESLNSMLTAGTTASEDDSDETEETSDDTDSASGEGDQDPEDREVMRIEEERRRREEEEERKRAEFFGSTGHNANGKRPQIPPRVPQHFPMPSSDLSRVERFAQPPTPSPPSTRPTSPTPNRTKNDSPLPLASSPYKSQSPSPALQQAKLPPSPSPQEKEVPSRKYKRPTIPTEFFAPTPLEPLSGRADSLASRDTNSPAFGRDSLTIPSDVASGRTTPSRSPTPQRSTTAPLTSSGLVASRKETFERQSSPSMVPSKSEMGRPSSTTPLYNMFARGESVSQRSFNAMPEKDLRSSPFSGEASPENNLLDDLRSLDKSPDYKSEGPPVGLARSLSKKSIERRRSEKSLKGLYDAREGPVGPSTESVFARHAGVMPKEFMPPLPPAPTPAPSKPELRKQQSLGNVRSTRPGEAASLPGPLADYHHPNNSRHSITSKPGSLSKATRPPLAPTASITSKGSLAKAFGKMLKNSQESELAAQPTRQDFPNHKPSAISRRGGKKIMQMGAPHDEEEKRRWSGQPPSINESFGMYPAENSEQYDNAQRLLRRTPSGKFVSLIAQELRKEAGVECDCDACRGLVDGDVNAECRRLSILATPDVRRSLELRHRRGASIEQLNDIIHDKARRESGIVVSGVENAGNPGWKVGRKEGTVAQRNSLLRNDRPVDTRSGVYSEISGSEPVLLIQEDSSDDGDDDEEEEEFIIKRDDDESTILSAARKPLPPLHFGTVQDQRPGDRSSTVRAPYLIVPPEASSSSNPASHAIRRLPNVRDLKHVSSIKEVEDDASKNKTSWQSVTTADGAVPPNLPANHAPYANGSGVRSGLVFNPGNTHRTVTVLNVGDTSSIVSSEIPEVGIMRDNDVVLLQENKKKNRHPLRHEIPPEFMESNISSTVDATNSGMANEAKKRVEAYVQQQVDVLSETSTSPRRSGRTYSLPPPPKTEPMATIGPSGDRDKLFPTATIGPSGDKDKLFPTAASTLASRPSYSPSSMRVGKNQTMSSIPKHLSDSNFSLIDKYFHPSFILNYRSEFIAQQFCLIEKDVLLEVQWEELVHVRWTKMKTNKGTLADTPEEGNNDQEPQEADTRISRRKRKAKGMGGVEKLIERFNLVCQWVATEIVCTKSLELRVRVIAKFIRIAQKCRVYSNFATLVQILLGLQSPSVSRLRRTWSRVGTHELKVLDELSAFTSPFKNWKHIRDNMNTVAEEYGMSPIEIQIEMPGTGTMRGIQDWVNPKGKIKIPFGGCIPFLGIFLSDLVFNAELPAYIESKATKGQTELNRIYQNHVSNSEISLVQKQPLVNFHKHRTTATVIKRILTFQNLARRYPFEINDFLYGVCSKLLPLEPDLVRELSKSIEED